jgi:uncharacterized cupin superfamily protein
VSKRIDAAAVKAVIGTLYPPPFDEPCRNRERRRLGDAAGLQQLGVNLLRLPPGSWSSQRHWHSHEDEFVYVLSGEVTLVTDAGEQKLGAGRCVGYPANSGDAHHLINRGGAAATYLEVGSRVDADECFYPDDDLLLADNNTRYAHKDGSSYP